MALKAVAKIALFTGRIQPGIGAAILAKHFMRKHRPNAYCGQGKK